MALTRAQLLSGNRSQGVVLSGQVQGVSQGTGVLINSNGQLSVDASTVTGLVKLNNAAAYNSYVWPSVDGSSGQFLQTDGDGNLMWASAQGFGVVIVSAIEPINPDVGELWFDCGTGLLKVYQNCVAPTGWTAINGGSGGGGLPPVAINVSSVPAFVSGGGSVTSPYVIPAVALGVGASKVIATITVTGLAPNQSLSIVDQNANINVGRFTITNNVANNAGTLVFEILYTDVPNSASGQSYQCLFVLGTGENVYITGTVNVADQLAVTPGVISGIPEVGVATNYTSGTATGGTPPYSYTYQWAANGIDLPGQTGTSYTPTSSDLGKTLSVRITARDSVGSTVSASATASVPVENQPFPETIWNPIPSDGMNSNPGGQSGTYIGAASSITTTGCIEASVNGGPYSVGTQTIASGQTLAIRWAATPSCGLAATGTTITGSLTDGSLARNYSLRINRVPSPGVSDISTTGIDFFTATSKRILSPVVGINSTAYVTYAASSTGTNIEASTDGINFFPLQSSGTGFPIELGNFLYIAQTTGGSAGVGYKATIRVGDGTNVNGTYDEFTFTATSTPQTNFPNSVFSPAGGPNASPSSVNIPSRGLYGTAICSSWADGSRQIYTTGGLQYSINAGAYLDSQISTINNGDTLRLIWDPLIIASAADGATLSGTLTNGSLTSLYTITIDRSPVTITYNDRTQQPISTVVVSDSITPYGANVPITLSFAGTATALTQIGASLSGNSFLPSPLVVNPGQSIQFRGTTGAANSTTYGVNISLGSGPAVTDTWTVTTEVAVATTPEISTPLILAPANNSLDINPGSNTPAGITFVSTTYNSINGAGAQTSALWEAYEGTFPLTSSNAITAVNTSSGSSTFTSTYSGAVAYALYPQPNSIPGYGLLVSYNKRTLVASNNSGSTWTFGSRTTASSNREYEHATASERYVLFGEEDELSALSSYNTLSFVDLQLKSGTGLPGLSSPFDSQGSNKDNYYVGSYNDRFVAVFENETETTTYWYYIDTAPGQLQTWTYFNPVGLTQGIAGEMVRAGNALYMLEGGGYRSTDGGLTWNGPLTNFGEEVRWVSESNGVVWISTDESDGSFYRSTDNGSTWTRYGAVSLALSAGMIIFGGAGGFTAQYFAKDERDQTAGLPIYTSVNGGLTFTFYANNPRYFSRAFGENIAIRGQSSNSTGSGVAVAKLPFGSTILSISNAAKDGFYVGDLIVSSPTGGGPSRILSLSNSTVTVDNSSGWLSGGIQRITRDSSEYTPLAGSPFLATSAPFDTLFVPESAFLPEQLYHVRVQYATTNPQPATSEFSPWSDFITIAGGFDITPGLLIGGGYYAGQVNDGGTVYNIIVAPRVKSSLEGQYGGAGRSYLQYKTSNTADTPNSTAVKSVYGGDATVAFADSAHSCFNWCINTTSGPNNGQWDANNTAGTGINGYNDWYIPASEEWAAIGLVMCPPSTSIPDFGPTGVERFEEDYYYQGSSQSLNNPGYVYQIDLTLPSASYNNKTIARYARAIRRQAA